MVRVLLYTVPVILAVWAIVDFVQTAAGDVRRLPRPLWFFVILLIPVIGPIAWLMRGRVRVGRGGKRNNPGGAPRPVAPDDDPDFLRKLRTQKPPTPPTPPASTGDTTKPSGTGSADGDGTADSAGDEPSGGQPSTDKP